MSSDIAGADVEDMSYEEFGRRFFEYAVQGDRIQASLADLDGEPVGFEPKTLMGLLTVSADGHIGTATVIETGTEPLTFHATIPVNLEVAIQLAAIRQSFLADIRVGLTMTACAREPLRIFIHVQPPRTKDVHVQVETRDLGVSVINSLGTIEQELRRLVAWQVRQRLESPDMQEGRDFDVATRIQATRHE